MSLQKTYFDAIPHSINTNNINTSNRMLGFNARTTVLMVMSIAMQTSLTRTSQVDSHGVVPKQVPLDLRKFDSKSNFKGDPGVRRPQFFLGDRNLRPVLRN